MESNISQTKEQRLAELARKLESEDTGFTLREGCSHVTCKYRLLLLSYIIIWLAKACSLRLLPSRISNLTKLT